MILIDKLRDLSTYIKTAKDLSKSPEELRAWERRRRAILTALSSALYRSFSLLFPILTISLFLRGLGVETYGLWMTVTSFFSLFVFTDLGLGAGLLTRLSQACGQDDIEGGRRLVASAFFMLVGIAGVLLLFVLIFFPVISWAKLLNAASAAGANSTPWIVWSVVISQIIQIPFSIVYRTELAMQEGYKYNLWQSLSVALNMITVFILVRLHASPLMLITSTSIIPVLVMALNWFYFFWIDKPFFRPRWSDFNTQVARSLLGTGSAFVLLGIIQSLGISLDNFLVSRMCGVNEVAPFAVASRVAGVLSLVVEVLSMPMWSAYGEALARGDHTWVRRSCLRLSGLSCLLATAGGVLLVLFGPWVFTHWLGKDLEFNRTLLVSCSLRAILLSTAAPFFMVLNGSGSVRSQVKAFLIFTPLSFVLKILLAKNIGSSGVALGMVAVYGVWILPWVYRKAMTISKSPPPPTEHHGEN